MTIPISQNWTGRRGHLNSNSGKAKNDRLVLTFLLGTVRGVPCLRMPPSICTPNTMGSRVLNIQLGKILSLHGKTAISLCCSLNLCFRSCNRVGHEMTKFLYTTTSCTLSLPIHYHFLYTITSHTLSLPIHYHFLYTITSHTLPLPVYYHFLYTITSCTLPLPIHYHFLYTITSHTLSLPIHYHFLYTITSHTLPLPVYYHFLYTITSHTLPPQCRPYLPVLHKVVKEVVDNVCSEYLHPQLVSVLLCLPLHTDIKG